MDVVVPFRGERAQLEEVRERLARLRLNEDDSVLVVDNTPGSDPIPRRDGEVPVLHAPGLATPGFARNRGVAAGSAEWLAFFDGDVVPPPDLLDRYFDPEPADRTAILAGGIVDEPVPPGGRPAARYAHIREHMSQDDTFKYGEFGFPKTANAAFRRSAFEQVGGFREDIRAAEDADLTYRLKAAGWELERREQASAVHLNRATVRAFVVQKALHGAGGAWLANEYPGAFPARRRPGLVWWGVRHATRGLYEAARSRDRDRALWAVFEPLEQLTYEFGRSLPNTRPLRRRGRRP